MAYELCPRCGWMHYRTDPCRPKRIAGERGTSTDRVGRADITATPATKSTAARKNARVMVQRECEVCGNAFEAIPNEVKRGKARTCSKACAAKLAERPDQTGPANPNWKGGVTSTEKNKRYAAKHPEKHAAHLAMTAAIRRGELVRQPCEVCGDTKTDGHHDDYSKPLDVRWLCREHHIEHHKSSGTQTPPVDTPKRGRGRPKVHPDRKAYKATKERERRARRSVPITDPKEATS